MPWASPSSLDRAVACPASCVLPRVKQEKDTPSQAWGHEVHAWKAGEEPTKRVAKWAEENYQPGILGMLWPGGRHEVIFLEHEGKVTELSKFPEVRANPWDMYFIADWIRDDGFIPHIDDLKTGRLMPESKTQLFGYAWAFNQVRHFDEVLASYTHWPRYPKGAPPARDTRLLSSDEVEAWHNSVVVPARRLAQGPGAASDVRPGQHCRYCNSKPYCPAWADPEHPPVDFE